MEEVNHEYITLNNGTKEQIREVVEATEIKPAFVQVEAHPHFPQTALKEYLKPMGTAIMAWYPLGHGDRNLVDQDRSRPRLLRVPEKG